MLKRHWYAIDLPENMEPDAMLAVSEAISETLRETWDVDYVDIYGGYEDPSQVPEMASDAEVADSTPF